LISPTRETVGDRLELERFAVAYSPTQIQL
jgi:hypothetical protein